MANIKFSDFTVGNTEGDIDFVVGYKGASNIQISPTNLLASALGNYLPLAGGTMTGTSGVVFPDTFKLKLGTSSDFNIYHSGSHSYLENYTGDIIIQNNADNKDIIFQCDDGLGGTNTYFYLDGSATDGAGILGATVFPDKSKIYMGTSGDLEIFHDSNDSYIKNYTGDLYIENFADNKDIIFKSDNGSGGVAEYFKVDGGVKRNIFSQDTNTVDNIGIYVGTGLDFGMYHDGTHTYLTNDSQAGSDLYIRNATNDGDMIFQGDDGSGGLTQYFRVDGDTLDIRFSKDILLFDNVTLKIGAGQDLRLQHSSGNNSSYIQNYTGDLYIENLADDKDIIFKSDDGSGGTTEYFRLDGSRASGAYTYTTRPDGGVITFGDGLDLRLWHDPNTNKSYMRGYNHDLYIEAITADTDILFRADDGSGGLTTYFQLDGSHSKMIAYKDIHFEDNIKARFGNYATADLEIYHDTTDSWLDNFTGNLNIRNQQNSGDIIFRCDNGNGGVAEYFRLDGGDTEVIVSKNFVYLDSVEAKFGGGNDLKIYHDGNNSNYITSTTSDIYLRNEGNNDRTYIQATNNGTIYNHITIDGSEGETIFSRNTQHSDSVYAQFGTGKDLKIYHDGSNSYIQDTGTGNLLITSDGASVQINKGLTENMAEFITDGAVKLYYDSAKKLETTSTGIKISGVSEYADNTAALAGGLTTGDVYRTGDLLKIVH